MIAMDADILIYACKVEYPFNSKASNRVRELAESRSAYANAWPCLHEFYSTVAYVNRYQPPSTPPIAVKQIALCMDSPTLQLISETPTHWTALHNLRMASVVKDALVHGARIAAVCLLHGVREFWAAEQVFSRFPALTRHNPLLV